MIIKASFIDPGVSVVKLLYHHQIFSKSDHEKFMLKQHKCSDSLLTNETVMVNKMKALNISNTSKDVLFNEKAG